MREEFIEPAASKARAYADEHHPRRKDGRRYPVCGTHLGRHAPDFGAAGNALLCCGGGDPHSELSRFGAGVVLYFKWLKFLFWLFVALTLASGPQLVLNVASYSGRLSSPLGFFEATAMSSLAARDLNVSLVSSFSSATGTNVLSALLDCGESCQDGRVRLAWLYSASELLVAAIFCLGVAYLRLFERREEVHIQKHSITVEEYTVHFLNPPPKSGESAIKRFFEELTGEAVLEVNCAYNSGALIGLYVQRGKVINKLWKAASKVYMLREEMAKADVAHQGAVQQQQQHQQRPSSTSPRRSSASSTTHDAKAVAVAPAAEQEEAGAGAAALGARFNALRGQDGGEAPARRASVGSHRRGSYVLSLVTVQDAVTRAAEQLGLVQGRLERAVADYDALYASYEALGDQRRATRGGNEVRAAFVTFETQVGFLRCLDIFGLGGGRTADGKRIKFQGRRVRVEPAPPPSTVLWENFDFLDGARWLRRAVTLVGALAVVAVSAVLTYMATLGRQVLKGEIAATSCELPGNVTSLAGLEALAADAARAGDAAGAEQYRALLLGCLCGLSTFSQAFNALFDPSSACFSYWADKAPLVGVSLLITVFVAVSNLAIRVVLTRFSEWERHRSVVSMEKSLMQRVFWTLMLNTGIIIFIVNYDVRWLFALGRSPVLVVQGYRDFVADWYSDVGVQILLIMMLNTLAPHGFVAIELAWVHCVRRNPRCSKPSSQRELNDWHTGPEFRAHYRYAQNLMTVFVTMLYGPGLPLLYPLAALSFAVYLWVDKYLLLRYFKTPPRMDGKLARKASAFMLWAVVPNLVFAVWMYSTPAFFWFSADDAQEDGYGYGYGNSSSMHANYIGNAVDAIFGHGATEGKAGKLLQLVSTRATLPFVAPLAAACILSSAALLLSWLFPALPKLAWRCCDALLCGLCSRLPLGVRKIFMHPDLRAARKRGLVRGIDSYSLLCNPAYAAAFGVDTSFARNHRRLESMDDLSADQLPTLPVV